MWSMAQWVKCSIYRYKDLSLVPRPLVKEPDSVCKPGTEKAESEKPWHSLASQSCLLIELQGNKK